MKDDYLWDKSGQPDPEIQKLEEILGTLRYQPKPLELPQDRVPRVTPHADDEGKAELHPISVVKRKKPVALLLREAVEPCGPPPATTIPGGSRAGANRREKASADHCAASCA